MNNEKSTLLYDRDGHQCHVFSNLVEGEGVQANQFLIINGHHAALIDPGGDLTYTPLTIALSGKVKIEELDYVFASHQDPDIIASLPRWLMHTNAKIVCSNLWSRFLPHLASSFVTSKLKRDLTSRLIGLPDGSSKLRFGNSSLYCIPAHFLHSVGNFQLYDPVSKILFSGDMGASMVSDQQARQPVADFQRHITTMKGFHQRYMCSKRATRLWANMVRDMDVEMIVPQHGSPFVGKAMINEFLDWISDLDCGVDLLTQESYSVKY
ncbi:metallo-beta-lactamase superfamily protein [Sinobacterium caligoides]|uniref:Metallo-beta-lactamase superfamily protein n=1 Tax=Sinobacterium caligoides TaxID=933926 RepID=A0A3N2E184_9GAMM|nr:MBL fold metallo-hydrolase [Sinobacterium caligoides]ROS05335.1 metallo-beta-lactamase superfamily protein [Sinobacterium caligoides]